MNFTNAFVEPTPSESAQVFSGSLSASCGPVSTPSPNPGPGPAPGPRPGQLSLEEITLAVAVTGSIGGLVLLSLALTTYFRKASSEKGILDTEKIAVTL